MNNESHPLQERLVHAYNRMLERAKHVIDNAKHPVPTLQHLLHEAKETAVDLGELTQNEADKVSTYVKRDIHDAARSMQETQSELAEWLRFDIELVEERLAAMFELMTDHTRSELDRIAQEAEQEGWTAGEVTSVGSLTCTRCGHELHFHATKEIPPCPACGGLEYRRAT